MNTSAITDILSQLDRELWLVTAQAAAQRGGLIATFVSNASVVADLPRMLIGLAKHHHTWHLIEASGAFALHLLDEDHVDWVWRFGLSSGRGGDKLDGLDLIRGATGSPLLSDALAWLDCRVEARLDTGDRTVYLAEVVASARLRPGAPLSFQRLLALAPPEKKTLLKEALARDAAVDAAAIHEWRQRRAGPTSDSAGESI
jgi:flavin reductase (DIM6/NTAB) family NADH-FMN oxidoreductase RutF